MIRRHGNNAPRKPHHAPANLRPAPAALTPAVADRIINVADLLRSMADAERRADASPAPRLRLGEAKPARTIRCIHPLERTAPAIAFLRAQGLSVTKAASDHHGTIWYVSGETYPLNAAGVINAAEQRGFGQ